MGVAMRSKKGAIHIVESAIAVFILFSFVLFAFRNIQDGEQASQVYSDFADDLVESLAFMPEFTSLIESKNLTAINSTLSRYIHHDFDVGYESLMPEVFIVEQPAYQQNFSSKQFDRAYLEVFSPSQSFVNISLNSNMVFSSYTSREINTIDVSSYLAVGTNRIEINTTSQPIYVLIFSTTSQLPQVSANADVNVVTQPYFDGEEVYFLYVFMYQT